MSDQCWRLLLEAIILRAVIDGNVLLHFPQTIIPRAIIPLMTELLRAIIPRVIIPWVRIILRRIWREAPDCLRATRFFQWRVCGCEPSFLGFTDWGSCEEACFRAGSQRNRTLIVFLVVLTSRVKLLVRTIAINSALCSSHRYRCLTGQVLAIVRFL